MRLAPKPKLFRHAPRGNVIGLAGRDDTVRLERSERMSKKRLRRLGGIAPSLERAAEGPADLVGLRREPRVKRHVSDDLAARFFDHRDGLAAFALMVAREDV